jgi:hypothetical protein
MIALPMRRLWFVPCALGAALVVVGPVASVRAAPALPAVTLRVSDRVIAYGQYVRFSGHISPRSAGQTVAIENGKGRILAKATTDFEGRYHVRAKPRRNILAHAQWAAVASDPVRIGVRPRLTASRTAIRLFGITVVRGTLVPAHAHSHIDVMVVRNGRPVQRYRPMLRWDGRFRVGIRILHPGTQSVVVHFDDADHLGVAWRSNPATPPLPGLRIGSNNIYVRFLEWRLADLHYRVYAQDSRFDYHDSDSVVAFHKVQGMARTGVVDTATWYRLARPIVPVIRGPKFGNHFEVNLTKQVVMYVHRGRIAGILHASTGKPSTPTRPGNFRVWSKQPGFNSEGMFYSSFFDGNRALHGYHDVPVYAASHGCVRLPFWHARWVYNRATIGTQVLVYN